MKQTFLSFVKLTITTKKTIMTAKELNRDINRLAKNYKKALNTKTYYEQLEEIKTEYKRLFYCDSKFEYMNLKSIKIMIRLNLTIRIIPFHLFGLSIEI